MKKGKGFNVGDKVFAKVKGYPAWPAKVVGVNGKRYQVQFYGTGETGIIKIEDLFYYLKHKNQFVKNLRRKDYNDALEEIETAVAEEGTDGSDRNENDSFVFNESEIESNSTLNDSNDVSKSGKRKRPSLDDGQQIVKKTIKSLSEEDIIGLESELSHNQIEEGNSALIESDDEERAEEISPNNSNNISTNKIDKKNYKKIKNDLNTQNKDKTKFKIISNEHLKALIVYAEHVRKDPEKYKNKPPEVRARSRNEIVVAKTPNDQFISIKYNRDAPPTFESEYDHAIYDENEAKTILSLKELVELGSCNSEDDPKLFETNLVLTEEEVQDALKLQLLERKTQIYSFLKIEQTLVELDSKIKACLGLDEAEPKKALTYLEKILEMRVDPLMLIKHPHVVDMVKRLRRYVGNIKEWNLAGDGLTTFQADAANIREIANKIFVKFAKLLGLSTTDDKTFFDELNAKVEEFKVKTSHLGDSEVFPLSVLPGSRQSFLDALNEEEEMKLISNDVSSQEEKMEESEQENSQQINEELVSSSQEENIVSN